MARTTDTCRCTAKSLREGGVPGTVRTPRALEGATLTHASGIGNFGSGSGATMAKTGRLGLGGSRPCCRTDASASGTGDPCQDGAPASATTTGWGTAEPRIAWVATTAPTDPSARPPRNRRPPRVRSPRRPRGRGEVGFGATTLPSVRAASAFARRTRASTRRASSFAGSKRSAADGPSGLNPRQSCSPTCAIPLPMVQDSASRAWSPRRLDATERRC